MPVVTVALPTPRTASSSTPNGNPPAEVTDAGIESQGSWAGTGFASQSVCELQAVPANCRVQLSGTGIVQIGPNQYQVTLSLSGTNTVTLVPNAANALNHPTTTVAPQVFSWQLVSRNAKVCTVSGLVVTAVGRGQVEILCRSFRDVNASFAGATPSGTESVDASLLVTVVA